MTLEEYREHMATQDAAREAEYRKYIATQPWGVTTPGADPCPYELTLKSLRERREYLEAQQEHEAYEANKKLAAFIIYGALILFALIGITHRTDSSICDGYATLDECAAIENPSRQYPK